MSGTVFVIKVQYPERVRLFFELFGMSFEREQHGDGPVHYACERDGNVFEIYPGDGKTSARFVKELISLEELEEIIKQGGVVPYQEGDEVPPNVLE